MSSDRCLTEYRDPERGIRLAREAHGFAYADIPAAVLDVARLVIVDAIGCMLAGSQFPPGATVIDVVRCLFPNGGATILGAGVRSDPVSAGYANAVLANVLDFDPLLIGKPASATVAAALAVGESVDANGKDILAAVVAGHEIGFRVFEAVAPSAERGAAVTIEAAWHALPAAIVSARLLRLTVDEFLPALGYAAASGPLPISGLKYPRPFHWLKNNLGEQARAGIFSAYLARRGFVAPRHLFDSDLGFWRMLGSDCYRPDRLSDGLGQRWVILDTFFKPYPVCRHIMPALQALHRLAIDHDLAATTVSQAVITVDAWSARTFVDRRPRSAMDGSTSIPYAGALLLLGRPPSPAWYAASALDDPVIHAVADRIDVRAGPPATGQPGSAVTVDVTTSDGGRFQARREGDRSLCRHEILDKFLVQASTVLPISRAEACLDLLLTLDREASIRPLMRLLTAQR